MAELPIDLKKLETVRGALDIIKYLSKRGATDTDDIMDDLGLSTRGFDKAKRRLVTTGYIQMQSDYVYELTPQGEESAQTLFEFDGETADNDTGISRQSVIILPRNLVVGKTSQLKVAFEPNNKMIRADLVVRISSTHADLGDWNEMVKIGSDVAMFDTTITPQYKDKARVKMEVFQLTSGGEGLAQCGGMYVDLVVMPSGDTGEEIAYGTELNFQAD